MNRVNATTGELTSPVEIKRALNASFPSDADLTDLGYPFVMDDPQPTITPAQTAVLGSPYNDNGTWRRAWVVSDRPIEDIRAGMECTPLQGILAMDQAGMAEAYEAWSTAPERTRTERAFIECAQVWKRTDSTLMAGASALGITDKQLDRLFQLAMTL